MALCLIAGGAACAGGDDETPNDMSADAGLLSDGGIGGSDASLADIGISTPINPCDPVRNTGCDAPSVCKLLGVPQCVEPENATRPHRANCALGECAPGFVCIRESVTSTLSACAKLCNLESGFGCDVLGDFDCLRPVENSTFGICESLPDLCDPYQQTPCPDGLGCQPYLRRSGARELRCLAEGPGELGNPCGVRLGGCQRGLVCVADPEGQNAFCRQYCELSADCPAPEQCVGRVDDPPFTYCVP